MNSISGNPGIAAERVEARKRDLLKPLCYSNRLHGGRCCGRGCCAIPSTFSFPRWVRVPKEEERGRERSNWWPASNHTRGRGRLAEGLAPKFWFGL